MSEPAPGPGAGADAESGAPVPAPDFLDIAQIQAPHGVDGEMRARILTDFPKRFARLKTVYLGDEHTPARVQRARLAGPVVILKLAGVDTPEAAAKLRFSVVRVQTSEAVKLPPGVFFHYQIIGLKAATEDGAALGKVTDILTTGGNDVYVVEGEAGETLIPAIGDVVREIDLVGGRLVVRLMDGMEPRPLTPKTPKAVRLARSPRRGAKAPATGTADPSAPAAPPAP